MDTLQKILDIEEEFNLFKANNERKYIYFIILYFVPPLLAFLFVSKYKPDLSENLAFKIIVYGILLAGLVFHFILRNTYYKTNEKYRNFIEDKLANVKKNFEDEEEFKKSIIESAKEIFSMKKKVLTNELIKKDIFWNIVFILIGLEIETQDMK